MSKIPSTSSGKNPSQEMGGEAGSEALVGFEPPIDVRYLSQSDGQLRRNAKLVHLISSAAKVLVRDGHAKLSMRAVASEAGLRLSSLQHYFDSRDALLLETVRAIISSYLERYDALRRQRELSSAEILAQITDDVVAEAGKPEVCGFFMEVWTMARHHPQAGELLAQLYRRYRALLKELIMETNPQLAEGEADAIATMFAAQGEGLMIMSHHGSALRQPPETLRAMMQLVWPLACRLGTKGLADNML